MTGQFPACSDVRISGQLRLIGVRVSPSTVQAAWQRHGLTLRIHRVLWLEQKTAGRGGVLTERQIRLLQLHPGAPSIPNSTSKRLIRAICCARMPASSARSRASARSPCRASSMPAAR